MASHLSFGSTLILDDRIGEEPGSINRCFRRGHGNKDPNAYKKVTHISDKEVQSIWDKFHGKGKGKESESKENEGNKEEIKLKIERIKCEVVPHAASALTATNFHKCVDEWLDKVKKDKIVVFMVTHGASFDFLIERFMKKTAKMVEECGWLALRAKESGGVEVVLSPACEVWNLTFE